MLVPASVVLPAKLRQRQPSRNPLGSRYWMALPVACGWASPSLPSPHQKCFVMRWAGRTRPVQRCFRRSGLGAAPSYQYGPFGRCRIEFHHPVRGFGGVTVLLPLRMAPDT